MRRYIHKYGKWAVDERCQCGHARANHDALMIQVGGQDERKDGLGKCGVNDCQCPKFRRHKWVFEGEEASSG